MSKKKNILQKNKNKKGKIKEKENKENIDLKNLLTLVFYKINPDFMS